MQGRTGFPPSSRLRDNDNNSAIIAWALGNKVAITFYERASAPCSSLPFFPSSLFAERWQGPAYPIRRSAGRFYTTWLAFFKEAYLRACCCKKDRTVLEIGLGEFREGVESRREKRRGEERKRTRHWGENVNFKSLFLHPRTLNYAFVSFEIIPLIKFRRSL